MARAESYRILLAVAVLLDWDIEQVDIDTAPLYGDIDSEIYVAFQTEPQRSVAYPNLPTASSKPPKYGLTH